MQNQSKYGIQHCIRRNAGESAKLNELSINKHISKPKR